MNLKLKKEELQVLYAYIVNNAGKYRFLTKIERQLSYAVLKDLVKKIINKQFSIEVKSLKLTIPEALVLNEILPQHRASDPFAEACLSGVFLQVNKFCLSNII